MKRKFIFSFFALLFSVIALQAKQTEIFWIAADGSDETGIGDGTEAKPYKTIFNSKVMPQLNSTANKIINLKPGNYTAENISASKAGARIYGDSITINGNGAIFDLSDATGVVLDVNTYKATILKDITFKNGKSSLTRLSGLIMENCRVEDFTGTVFQCFGKGNNVISNSVFTNNMTNFAQSGNGESGGTLTFDRCYFGGGTMTIGGGDIYANLNLINCVFNATGNITVGNANHNNSYSTNLQVVNNTFYNCGIFALNRATLNSISSYVDATFVNNVIVTETGTVFGSNATSAAGRPAIKATNNHIIAKTIKSANIDETIDENANTLILVANNSDFTTALNALKFGALVTPAGGLPYLPIDETSLLLDAGIATYGTPNVVPETDILGATRAQNTSGVAFSGDGIDIGAYEFKKDLKNPTPNLTINYEDETLTGFTAAIPYTIGGTSRAVEEDNSDYSITSLIPTDGIAEIIVYIPGNYIAGNSLTWATTLQSDDATITVPARPAAPSVTANNTAGSISGTTTAMEYAQAPQAPADEWIPCSDAATPVSDGTYYVRYKAIAGESGSLSAATNYVGLKAVAAGSGSFASAATEVTVGKTTGIAGAQSADAVVIEQYYNLQGLKIVQPLKNQIYLVKKIFASGKSEVRKVSNNK